MVTMPGGARAIVLGAGHPALWTVDGSTPLTPPRVSPAYWASPLCRSDDLAWWHVLRVRDADGSAALRAVTFETARALATAARAAVAAESTLDDEQPQDMSYPDLGVTMRPAPAQVDAGAWPSIVAAVRMTLPDITHPELIAAVARMALVSARIEPALQRIREKAGAR